MINAMHDAPKFHSPYISQLGISGLSHAVYHNSPMKLGLFSTFLLSKIIRKQASGTPQVFVEALCKSGVSAVDIPWLDWQLRRYTLLLPYTLLVYTLHITTESYLA
jgi:hypothetical protein